MIDCPNCHHNELSGAYFCSECGTQLTQLDFLQTRFINKLSENSLVSSAAPQASILKKTAVSHKDPSISLHLVDSGKVIHLSDRKDFSLGRAVDGQSILPDIDLTQYDAFAKGVSRMHASLRIVNGEVYASDLGSSNGTRINGQKIMPHIEYSINHGDIIVLGKMRVQVLLIK